CMIKAALKNKISELAFRAPSVHNVQPWVLDVGTEIITVYDDLTRTLSVGDASLHDHEVSLGALIEGISLILSSEGLGISNIEALKSHSVPFQGRNLRERYKLTVATGFAEDKLFSLIARRKSYRGVFLNSSEQDRQALLQGFSGDLSGVVSDVKELKQWAKIYDRCSVESNRNRALQTELYQWMRFGSEQNYNRDGLNREALSISSIEGLAAKMLLKPCTYALLNKLGLAGVVMTEAPQISSATGLVVIFKAPGLSALENGRNFYRLWLQLTEAGFYACPLSALVDHPEGRKQIEQRFDNKSVLNVLRVGRTLPEKLYNSPRLPVFETLMGVNS
ncbi:MAG: hypothetical protein ACKOX6_13285, partial [Bdellovibrio sp.]